MNPVDHPHGGGEGRAPIGRPWPNDTLGTSQQTVTRLARRTSLAMT